MLEKFFEVSQQFLKIKNFPYQRYFIKRGHLKHRMSIIAGHRGVGKTTTLIQLLLQKVDGDRFDKKILYIQKVYLDNTNQLFAISASALEKGTLRETFFLSMLGESHRVTLPLKGDFLVNEKWVFEVGGKNKGYEQIKDEKHGFIASHDIEIGFQNRIPLWLFGFLY